VGLASPWYKCEPEQSLRSRPPAVQFIRHSGPGKYVTPLFLP
jgi:hypothetical protein